ncbi:MAG: hypothetical protein Q8O19_04665 [Rectinemataceae bacterium]|nr:hypothetical protein [Rectinemataceae bacterium]
MPILDYNLFTGHSVVKETTSDELVKIFKPMIGGVIQLKNSLETISKKFFRLILARFASSILLYSLNLCQSNLKNYKTSIMTVLEVFSIAEKPTSNPVFIDQDLSVHSVFWIFHFVSEIYYDSWFMAVSLEVEAYGCLI